MLREWFDKGFVSALDRVSARQAPLADSYVAWLGRRHPDRSTQELTRRLERQYLGVVTTSGVAVGLSAVIPGVGTVLGVVLSFADSAIFLEASALLGSGIAAAYGVDDGDSRRRHMVSEIVLGKAGTSALQQTAGHSSKQWFSVVVDRVPGLASMPDSPAKRFLVNFLLKRTLLLFGSVVPAGVGAVIGGTGNYALGNSVINNVHRSLGTGSPEGLRAGEAAPAHP
ncbi:hypothetical protein [Nocardia thailandica]|uniref:Uncharacterized protein n=1 Tax=Nocardia thailandica TaxID=257275 RepID=A0ABW6PNJ7_9NOCA|nr:hypothetical protein [Nocardia thailandica]